MPKNTFFTKPVFFPVLCLCLFLLLPLSVSADGAGTPAVSTSSVTLYGLDSYYEEYLEIPEGYPQSFRLEVTDAEQVSYRVSSGDSVTVSEDGVIAPRYTTWYWKNGIGSSFTAPPEDLSGYTITREGHYGDSVVTVTADGRTFDVSVAVLSYSAVYAESVMREHLDTHVTPGMTPLEKLRVICEFVAGYDYYYGFSGAEGMIASGKGGDCWASTDAVIRMAGMLGMRAWSRNGNKDSGAGNGHMNAMIEAEGRYYLADAGYAGTAPRFYSLRERTSLFSYCTYTGGDAEGVEVYQYDGIDVPESFRIPDSVDGSPVVSVGNLFARGSRMEGVKTLTLPDTVVHIGENAFYSMDSMEHISLGSGLRTLGSFAFSCCSALEEVCLPASLTSMGNNPFLCCSSLRTIIAEGADPAYTFKNDLLTTSDGTRLVCCLPSLSGELTVPEGVTVIGGQAFYETAITSVSLPDSLTALEDSVFLYCSSLTEVVIPGNVTSVGINALYSGSLNKVVFVSSACALADFLNAFFPGAEVYCRPDSPVASVCAENGYQTIPIPELYAEGTDVTLAPGETRRLRVYADTTVTGTSEAVWTVSDRYTASVGADGLVRAVNAGTAAVTASVGAYSLEFRVTVTEDGCWTRENGKWRYVLNDGTLAKGWKYLYGKWYWLDGNGDMVTGWRQIGGKRYYFLENGAMAAGWKEIGGKWYYFTPSGPMAEGWQKIGGKWYLFGENGIMKTGWKEVDGNWYYLDDTGEMVTGWKKVSGKWYYFNPYGAMVTGWKEIGGNWYFFCDSGEMAANEWRKGYWLNGDGTWTYPYRGSWTQDGTAWRFGDTGGWSAKNTTVRIDGRTYTFDSAGRWVG